MELTESEVKHIAKLAKISITEKEVTEYQKTLGELMSEVKQVGKIDITGDILIAPTNNENRYYEDETESIEFGNLIANAPHSKGNYVEVERVLSE